MSFDPRLDGFPVEYRERAVGVLGTLKSFFMTMPRGGSFCSREDFEKGYEAFSRHTDGARLISGAHLLDAIEEDPRAWLVLRCILGFTPPEAAYVAVLEAGESGQPVAVGQTQVRDLDARARRGEKLIWATTPKRRVERDHDEVLRRLVPLLAETLTRSPPKVESGLIHRLDKIDTYAGQASLAEIFERGVPYSELLYERLLGRPYASHRDSVSGRVGEYIEGPLAQLLEDYGIDGAMARPREKFRDSTKLLIVEFHGLRRR